MKTSADILFIWFPRKFLEQHSHKVQNDFSTFSLQFVPYFSKFIIVFQLVLRRIYRVALEIASIKKISLTSTGHAGYLPYANKTNKLRKIEYIIVKANIIRGSFTQQRRLPEGESQLIVQFARC